MTITDSTIAANKARYGGGIYNFDEATLNVVSSTVSGNKARRGGRLFNFDYGYLTIDNSTISGNTATATYGGGLYNRDSGSTMTVNNSTIVGNKAANASGGINNGGVLELNRSLISGNRAPAARELYNYGPGAVTLDNYNLIGVSSNSGTNVALGASDVLPTVRLAKIVGILKNNGGPTKTRAVVIGGPAHNATPTDSDCPATDQSGEARPKGGLCEIGSFEVQE
jgi:hypothetical protein